jgi:hypothetical protein
LCDADDSAAAHAYGAADTAAAHAAHAAADTDGYTDQNNRAANGHTYTAADGHSHRHQHTARCGLHRRLRGG